MFVESGLDTLGSDSAVRTSIRDEVDRCPPIDLLLHSQN